MYIIIYNKNMDLCKYSDIIGKPKEGIHSYRIFDISIVDVAVTILFIIFLYYLLNKSFMYIFTVVILIGIIVHKLFCVNSTINMLIFGKIDK
jgi:fatty-acid desaturase